MLSMLLAYDDDGNVIGTLDYLTARDSEGNVVGLVDFDAHERAGGEMTDVWKVDGAKGSKVWPEWIGAQAHDFKVETTGPAGRKKISALIHKLSGHRRERSLIEDAIKDRLDEAGGGVADIRDLVGGPDRPIRLDSEGKTVNRASPTPTVTEVPVIKTLPR
jgi:hypothetical protein